MSPAPHTASIISRLCPWIGIVVVAILFGCAPAQSRSVESVADRDRCDYYKAGEVRNVFRGRGSRVMRSMDGDFFRSTSESPSPGALYTVEVFRYYDRSCARERRQ